MPWWGWLLISWPALATLVGLLLGAVAKKARARERRWRDFQYLTAPDEGRSRSRDPHGPGDQRPAAGVSQERKRTRHPQR